MSDVAVLHEAALRRLVPIDLELIDAIEASFVALAAGTVVMPPVLHMDLPAINAELDVKTAWMPGVPGFAVKISAGFFDNPARGLPSLGGLMAVMDAATGRPRALLLDNGYLTDARTAAAGAVAARQLARPDASRVVVIGTGLQARLQVQALALVRSLSRIVVWGRDATKARAAADDLQAILDVPSAPASDLAAEVPGADIIVCTTSSRTPLLFADAIRPGMHVTAMGSDAPGKQEVDASLLASTDLLVCDRHAQAVRLGELQHASSADQARAVELGLLLAQRSGRRDTRQTTLCDLTGLGVQDTAIAALALARAGEGA